MVENNENVVTVSDPRIVVCLQRLSGFKPRPYTKFLLSRPVHKNKKWEIHSYVDYELVEEDAAVVIMLKKGLSVDEANYALWSVAALLKKASEEAKAAKKRVEEAAARKAGGVTLMAYWIRSAIKYLKGIASKFFNLPTELYYMVQRFLQRRK